MERTSEKSNGLTVASLFSGIGGLDLGFMYSGYNLVWANDFEKNAVNVYKENVDERIVLGDITEIYEQVPETDVLIGGFPCQPFSMMGKQKGFDDERGTLFFTIQRIIELHEQQPKILVLENVKNLLTHDHGRTFKKMKSILEDLGYIVHAKVLNTSDYGLPQNRRRVFVVAFLKDEFGNAAYDYAYPEPVKLNKTVYDLLDEDVDKKYFLSYKILPTIIANGSGNYHSKSEIGLEVARPLTATMHKMHRANQDNYYEDFDNRAKFTDTPERPISSVRRLTPNECRKLQGFPSDWKYVTSDTQAYKQFGNAVSVNVSYAVAQSINEFLRKINYHG